MRLLTVACDEKASIFSKLKNAKLLCPIENQRLQSTSASVESVTSVVTLSFLGFQENVGQMKIPMN